MFTQYQKKQDILNFQQNLRNVLIVLENHPKHALKALTIDDINQYIKEIDVYHKEAENLGKEFKSYRYELREAKDMMLFYMNKLQSNEAAISKGTRNISPRK